MSLYSETSNVFFLSGIINLISDIVIFCKLILSTKNEFLVVKLYTQSYNKLIL